MNSIFGLPQVLNSIQMIIICVVTDSLVYEKPEANILLRKPHDWKKVRLADGRVIFQAYAFLGVLESLTG